MNEYVFSGLDVGQQDEGLEGCIIPVNDACASQSAENAHGPVNQFSGILVASTNDRWLGFARRCVAGETMYSA